MTTNTFYNKIPPEAPLVEEDWDDWEDWQYWEDDTPDYCYDEDDFPEDEP